MYPKDMKIIIQNLRNLYILCLFGLLVVAAPFSHADDMPQRLTVAELFTSQGCNSCPPADDVLAGLVGQKNILALSYSVDYWNYLGWKDTLAKPACGRRQKAYNRALGKSGVYTPQMIIQGTYDLVGSQAAAIHQKIAEVDISQKKKLKSGSEVEPKLSFIAQQNMIFLKISRGKLGEKIAATIWIIAYDFEKTVTITKGELKGQRRKYHNVVQSIKRVGSWMGDDIKLTLSYGDIGTEKYDGYAVLLQTNETGPIISAAKLIQN